MLSDIVRLRAVGYPSLSVWFYIYFYRIGASGQREILSQQQHVKRQFC